MADKKQIQEVLKEVIHPELGSDIVSNGIVETIETKEERVTITLNFPKSRDPFINSIKKHIKELLTSKYTELLDNLFFVIKEAAPKKEAPKEQQTDTKKIAQIIAIASGKGGVGKSTVTSNLAVTMAKMGYAVGILDADIYGPSQAKMFGVEDYKPGVEVVDNVELIVPAEAHGVKVMSIAFFINSDDALIWRGPMATNALKQLIHQTQWGELDYLLIDLPPGTGDIHLGILQELQLNGAIIVSTPQQVAIADAIRGIKMFNSPKIEVPILGIVENMAWFTPDELPNNRYYIFGKDGATKLAKESNLDLLGQIPLTMGVMEGGDNGKPGSLMISTINDSYQDIVVKLVNKLK